MELTGKQIRDASVQRVDLDTVTVGQAVITKLIAGTGVTLTQTGADAGTGDVTINVTGGGGGGSGTAGHCSTMTRASAKDILGITTTNTTVYFTDLVADAGFTITTASQFEAEITQTSSGSFRFILTDASYNMIAYSALVTNPAVGMVTALLSTFASGTSYVIAPGVRYNLGVMSNQNSPLMLGIAATQYTNIAPYPSIRFDNIGSMTPPASFSGGSESLMRVYARLKV